MSSSVFFVCQAKSEAGNTTEILQCISDQLENEKIAKARDLNDFLLVIAGAMIFFMQSGFAMLCAGSVRLKNVQNTMLKNLLDACGAALAFYLVGKYARIELCEPCENVTIMASHRTLISFFGQQGTPSHLVVMRILLQRHSLEP